MVGRVAPRVSLPFSPRPVHHPRQMKKPPCCEHEGQVKQLLLRSIAMKISDQLNTAADVLEARGWNNSGDGDTDPWGMGGETAPICIEGAIAAAVGTGDIGTILLKNCPAARAVHRYLDLGPDRELWKWNDHTAKSADEVVEVLRATALVESVREQDGNLCTTSAAHVRSVAARHELPVITAGDYLYCVRRVPLLGQPIIYRATVTA